MIGVTLDQDRKRIYIKSPYELRHEIKKLPGRRWDPSSRRWWIPATSWSAKAVDCWLANQGVEFEIDEGTVLLASTIGADQIRDQQDDLPGPEKVVTKPYRHQRRGYNMIDRMDACLLAWDMGTGKSKVIVDYICNRTDPVLALIICPAPVVQVWPEQFSIHGASDVSITPLREGSTKKRAEKMRSVIQRVNGGRSAVFVINYEALTRTVLQETVLSVPWDLVVLDEGHRIKAPGGKASMFCKQLGSRVPKRVILSGTPMAHSPLDVYAQFRFLDPGVFGTSYTVFRSRYAIMGGFENRQVLGFKNENELNNLFYCLADKVDKRDVLDLPPLIDEHREAQLSPEELRVYEELEEELIADVQSGVVKASNALTRLLRLQQITSGFTITEDGKEVTLGQSKKNLLRDTLKDIGPEPVVVFSKFRIDVEAVGDVFRELGWEDWYLYGGKDEYQGWRDRPIDAPKGLSCQIQAGREGIDLTDARYLIYFSLGFSLSDYLQSKARLDRGGQERSVTAVHLAMTARGSRTVDHQVMKAILTNNDVIQHILNDYE